MRFWRLLAASGILLALGDGGASADPKPPAPASPVAPPAVGPVGPLGLQGAPPNLANPPTIKFGKTSLTTAGKLAVIRTGLHVVLTEQNIDAPVQLSARTPWVNNGQFQMNANLVNQWMPGASEGPYLDVLPYGSTAGTFHPHMSISFVVYPDRGALIDCTGGGGGALDSHLTVDGSAPVVNSFTSFPDGHVTAVVPKAPNQRAGSFMIRSMPGGSTFAIGSCEITPIRY